MPILIALNLVLNLRNNLIYYILVAENFKSQSEKCVLADLFIPRLQMDSKMPGPRTYIILYYNQSCVLYERDVVVICICRVLNIFYNWLRILIGSLLAELPFCRTQELR
ncbi:hypothetical protein ACP275_01G116900 [Erythranthe tilingii]